MPSRQQKLQRMVTRQRVAPDEMRRTRSDKTTHHEGGHLKMPWILLGAAGLLEIGWAIGLKYTEGFTRLVPSVLTATAIVGSMLLLSLAARDLPIGTAYAVWVGIGAAGAGIAGMVLFGDPATAGRILFLSLLIVSVIGLKLTS